ncbi:MAG: prolipoprotein diacylglyceryl transferase [Cocleimonas sp.]
MLTHPGWDPILIHFTETQGVRWYGLMYVLGFLSFLFLGKMRARRAGSPVTPEQVDDMMFFGAIGVIAGGRIGEMFFYRFSQLMADPFSLFRIWDGGMSFHGGLLGVTVAMLYLARKWKIQPLKIGDFIAPLVPIGLGAVRFANFIIGELWGRPTDVPWGMVFPKVDNLPRHPSQLYEVLGEGIILFLLVWIYSKKPRPLGAITGLFLLGYGVARSFVEFYRTPDNSDFLGIKWLTEGQLLSIPMIIIGLFLIVRAYTKDNNKGAKV